MIRPHYVPLYQSVCTSEKLADLASGDHRFFYVCLLTHMDSWGRCAGSARVLTAKVWPMLGKRAADTEKALADLERVGLIVRYSVGDEQFLTIPDWEEKAGKVGKLDRRGPSLCPEPPPPACRTSPAYGPDTQADAGVVLPRARAQSEPSRAEPRREEPRESPPGPVRAPRVAADAASLAVLPTALDTEAFRARWSDFLADRRSRRKPVTERAANLLLRKLEPWGAAKAIAALDRSIEAGWSSVFEPDDASRFGQTKGPAPKPLAQQKADIDRAALERDVERLWTERHTVIREVDSPLGGKVKRAVLDGRYPGFEAAQRELAQKASA